MAILGGSNIGACEAAMRQPEVNGWLDSLGYATERLLTLAAEMEKRLVPVLGPESPSNCVDKQTDAGCAIAANVQRSVTTLNAVEARLSDVLRRLEI